MGMKSDVELMFDWKKYLIFATQPFKMDGENKNGMIHCRHPSHPPVIPGEVRCEFGTPFQDGCLCLPPLTIRLKNWSFPGDKSCGAYSFFPAGQVFLERQRGSTPLPRHLARYRSLANTCRGNHRWPRRKLGCVETRSEFFLWEPSFVLRGELLGTRGSVLTPPKTNIWNLKKWSFGRWYFSVAKQGQPSTIPIWAVEVEGITKNQRNMWMLHMAPPKTNSSPLEKWWSLFKWPPFQGPFGAFSQGDWVQRPNSQNFSTGTWRLCSHPLSLPRCHPLPWSGGQGSKVKLTRGD